MARRKGTTTISGFYYSMGYGTFVVEVPDLDLSIKSDSVMTEAEIIKTVKKEASGIDPCIFSKIQFMSQEILQSKLLMRGIEVPEGVKVQTFATEIISEDRFKRISVSMNPILLENIRRFISDYNKKLPVGEKKMSLSSFISDASCFAFDNLGEMSKTQRYTPKIDWDKIKS